MSDDVDVLVAGAGPVGMLLAGALRRHGLRCRIVDAGDGPSPLSKAIAVHARSLAMLDDLGLAASLIERGVRVSDVHFHVDGKALPTIDLGAIGPPFPFVLCVAQSETEELLDAYAAPVERRTTLEALAPDADGVTATLRRADGAAESVRARWLCGCDGAHSTVREQLAVGFEGVTYPELYWLGDVAVRWDRDPGALHAWIDEAGSLAFFPLPGRFRVLAQPGTAQDAPRTAPTLDELQAFARDRTGLDVELGDPGWLATFAINRRLVTTMRPAPNVFLLGDAAHIHSPTGGQGMNTGMQDAYNLAWKLAAVVGGAPDALLDSFEAERRPVIEAMERSTDQLAAFTFAKGLRARVRGHLAPLVFGLGAARDRFARELSMLGIDYRDSPLVGRAGGRLVADVGPLFAADGTPRRWLDLVRGPEHVGVVFAGAEPDAARGAAHALQQTGMRTWVVARDGDGDGAVRDPDGAAHARFGVRDGGIVVVRPDQYLADVVRGLDPAPALAVLRRSLGG